MSEPIRILIADDHPLFRFGLRTRLGAEPDLDIVGEAGSGEEAIVLTGGCAPDVVLMDLGTPSRDTLEEMLLVSRALARPIAMFVDESDEAMIGAAIDAGVSAYVVDGLRKERVRPILELAVRRFNAFNSLQSELREARTALADRKKIERAKIILMESRKMSEADAYALIRTTAMNQGRRIAEVADAIVTAADLLGGKA